jgi:hypothetical protein
MAAHAGLKVELHVIRTTGDRITDRPLHEFGGKGLFTKELEQALLANEVDFAVHSYKDVPVTQPLVDQQNLIVAAVPAREDWRDAAVMRDPDKGLLPDQAVVGTSSLRRKSQILSLKPDVRIEPPTGFVQPVIDGETTSYFEWVGAGSVDVVSTAGAMHQVSERDDKVQLIEFGFDLENLYIKVSGGASMHEVLAGGLTLSLNFLSPADARVLIQSVDSDRYTVQVATRAGHHAGAGPGAGFGAGAGELRPCRGAEVAVRRLVELKLPFTCLGLRPGAPVSFLVALNRGTTEVEHYPRLRPIEFAVPDVEFAASHWTA